MSAKHSPRYGRHNPMPPEVLADILARVEAGESKPAVGRLYGVTAQTVDRQVRRYKAGLITATGESTVPVCEVAKMADLRGAADPEAAFAVAMAGRAHSDANVNKRIAVPFRALPPPTTVFSQSSIANAELVR